MDTSDPDISFDSNGVCSHCLRFEREVRPRWAFINGVGSSSLSSAISLLKDEQRGEYDSVIGVSGGVDSSYLLHKAVKEWGLKPLAVHVDAGWNSELAVKNIENLTKGVGVDLHTHVVDWREMRDLQLAYLQSGLANQDVPQDHAFFAALYRFATKSKIRHVLTGSNYATESILPSSWGYRAMDSTQLLAVWKKFGKRPRRTFPIASPFDRYVYYPYIKKMKVVAPLNFIPYSKEIAKTELAEIYGWRDYGDKHGESKWTKWFQGYYLPVKFGFDKRRAHLSSQVVAGDLSRSDALSQVEQPSWTEKEVNRDIRFIEEKLQLNPGDLMELMKVPMQNFTAYPSETKLLEVLKWLRSKIKKSTP